MMGKKKIAKDDPLFHVLGSLDELNSWLGLCRANAGKDKRTKEISSILEEIQQTLFICQAEVASVGAGFTPKVKIISAKTKNIEKEINIIDSQIPEITKFIIPGGSELSAHLDVARVLARKNERMARTFARKKKLRPELLQYLNRLSSILFALARFANFKLKVKENNPNYK